MLLARFFLIFAMALFVWQWLGFRRSSSIQPTDLFAAFILTFFGPAVLLNPTPISEFSRVPVTSAEAARAYVSLAIMYGVLTLTYAFRPRVAAIESSIAAEPDRRIFHTIALFTLVGSILLILAPYFIQYKIDIIRFYSGQLSPSEYQSLRRGAHITEPVVGSALVRLRYTIFASIFSLIVGYFLLSKRYLSAIISGILLFFWLSASLSKLPIVIFLGYGSIIWVVATYGTRRLSLKWFGIAWILGLAATLSMLTLLYILQYPTLFRIGENAIGAGSLAVHRVFVEGWAVLLRYYLVYPNHLPFLSYSGSSLISGLFGLEARNTDLEVAAFTLGPTALTTSPTIYVGNAYALGGELGVGLLSLIVGTTLIFIELTLRKLRVGVVRLSYYAIVLVNVVFFGMVSALTALLTYGLALFPALFLAIDWFASRGSARAARAGAKHS